MCLCVCGTLLEMVFVGNLSSFLLLSLRPTVQLTKTLRCFFSILASCLPGSIICSIIRTCLSSSSTDTRVSSRNFLQAPLKVPRSLNNPVRAKQKHELEESEESERKKLRRQARNDENLDSSEEDEDEEHDGNWEHVVIEVVEVDDLDNLYTYDVAEAEPPRPVSPEIKVPRFAAYKGGAKPNSRLGEGTKRSIMDEEAEAAGAAARPGGETVTAAAFFAHVLHIFQMVRWCRGVRPYSL